MGGGVISLSKARESTVLSGQKGHVCGLGWNVNMKLKRQQETQGEKGGKKQGVVKRASPCEGQKMSRRKREFRSQLPNDKREKLTGRWTVRLSSQQLIRNAFWYTMTEQIFSG